MLMLSDLSINSIDCAVALSSSISNTRMQVPFVATLDSRSAGLSAAFVILGQSDSRYAIHGWLIRPYRRREPDLKSPAHISGGAEFRAWAFAELGSSKSCYGLRFLSGRT